MSNPLKRSALLLLLLLVIRTSTACECIWQGSFVDIKDDADLIVHATVLSTKGNSFDIWIDQTLKGNEFRETLRIWGKTAQLCRPNVDIFLPQTEWILAINKITDVPDDGFNPNTPNLSFGRVDDYAISACGAYWLSVSEGLVSGNIAKGTRWTYNPKMNPVLFSLIAANINNKISNSALLTASEIPAESKELLLDTKSFLRQQRN